MKAFVTGGTGFVGSHLVDELLDNEYEVRLLARKDYSRKDVEVVKGDITSKNLNECLKDIDIVFHIAALSSEWEKKKDFMKVNVEGTQNLANACVRKGIKIVYMSTAGVYGFHKFQHPIKEDEKISLHNAYSLSKFMGEKILFENDDIEAVSIRSPLIIGPRDRHALPALIEGIKKGKIVYIRNKENVISLSHPRDVALCLRLAGEKGKGIYNVKSFDCSFKNLFETFANHLGVDAPNRTIPYAIAYIGAVFLEGIYRAKMAKDAPPLTRFKVRLLGTERIIDCGKAERELGFKARYGMEETVKESVEWYMDNVYKKQFVI